jgi:hypothetical protein
VDGQLLDDVGAMTQHDPTDRWRFTLTRMFVAMTTIAMALGLLRSPLPPEVKIPIAVAVPLFWTGVAIVTFGSGLVLAKSPLARGLGDIVVLTGFVMAIVGFLTGLVVAFAGLITLIFYLVTAARN